MELVSCGLRGRAEGAQGGKAEMVGRLREEQEGTRVDSGGHRKVPSERYFHALFSALGLKEQLRSQRA